LKKELAGVSIPVRGAFGDRHPCAGGNGLGSLGRNGNDDAHIPMGRGRDDMSAEARITWHPSR
jgi:hypothetical protein